MRGGRSEEVADSGSGAGGVEGGDWGPIFGGVSGVRDVSGSPPGVGVGSAEVWVVFFDSAFVGVGATPNRGVFEATASSSESESGLDFWSVRGGDLVFAMMFSLRGV